MILHKGIYIGSDQVIEICRDYGITEPDKINKIIDRVDVDSAKWIDQAIESVNDDEAQEKLSEGSVKP